MWALLAFAALSAEIRPDTLEDDVAMNGNCTLREAVLAANADAAVDACPAGDGADVIRLGPGTWRLALEGDAPEELGASGDLDVRAPLTLVGAGMGRTAIDADGVDRVLHSHPGVPLTVRDLDLTGGRALPPPRVLDPNNLPNGRERAASGGAVLAEGPLTLERVHVRDNATRDGESVAFNLMGASGRIGWPGGVGGGVAAWSTAVIHGCRFSGNRTGNGGELLFAGQPPRSAGAGAGGALWASGGVTLTGSLFDDNATGTDLPEASTLEAAAGGAALFEAPSIVRGSTFVGNVAGGLGGALVGPATLEGVTVVGNEGVLVGGVVVTNVTRALRNSVVAGNTGRPLDVYQGFPVGPDCLGQGQISDGYNALGDAIGCGDVPASTDLVGPVDLLPLAVIGGGLPVLGLPADSPLRDAGAPDACGGVDQRGVARPLGAACDVGAVESDCGDGLVDAGEDCDDAGASEPCTWQCRDSACGDGFTNAPFEACDQGEANSDTTPDACRTDCALPACGDAVTDAGEQCDEAGHSATCDADCTPPSCGDGVHNPMLEACDQGPDNHDLAPGACRTDCALPACGDGVRDPGEGCDDGPDNGALVNGCRADCAVWSCGDGVVDAGEDCDDGPDNALLADACRPTCVAPWCGDGVVDAGEACDDGVGNGLVADACRPDCALPTCGDGVVDAGEACDDGPLNDDLAPGACRADCAPATCGDGVLDFGEQCDDANADPEDGCAACAVEAGWICLPGAPCVETEGCACASGPAPPGWAALLLLLPLARRRGGAR